MERSEVIDRPPQLGPARGGDVKNDDPHYDFWFWFSVMALVTMCTVLIGWALR